MDKEVPRNGDPCGSAYRREGVAEKEEELPGSNMWAQRAESPQQEDDREIRGIGSPSWCFCT